MPPKRNTSPRKNKGKASSKKVVTSRRPASKRDRKKTEKQAALDANLNAEADSDDDDDEGEDSSSDEEPAPKKRRKEKADSLTIK
jgi:hypothetical protein